MLPGWSGEKAALGAVGADGVDPFSPAEWCGLNAAAFFLFTSVFFTGTTTH